MYYSYKVTSTNEERQVLSIIHNLTQGKYQDLTYASVDERKSALESDKTKEEGDIGMGGDDGDKVNEKKEEVASHSHPMEKLKLQTDIYSYTLWVFVKEQNIPLISELMTKCFLTIMV